jgi:hypothetical protein
MLDTIEQFNITIPDTIVDQIYQLKNLNPKLKKYSTRGGWASDKYTPINAPSWITNILPKHIASNLLNCWFNINPPTSYNIWHRHLKIARSGVVYISIPKNSGAIEFRNSTNSLTIIPHNGLVITFPGDVEHQVLPNNSSEDRVCLVFNLLG